MLGFIVSNITTISVESKNKNVEGITLTVGEGISTHFTQFLTLSQVHILVVLFTEK